MPLSISQYRDEDAARVAELLDVAPELPSTSEEGFRTFAALSFNRGARDFVVVHDGELCVALLASTLLQGAHPRVRHFRIVVRPSHRRAGLASALYELLAEQEGGPGTVLQCNSQRSWAEGNAFLERLGFQVVRTELLMRRVEEGTLAPSLSGDIRLRPARDEDDAAWISLHRQAYGQRDDFSELDPDDLAAERAHPGFSLTIAERDGEVLGYCHGLELQAGEGLINSLVVRESARGAGLGAALLASTTSNLLAQGASRVSLNVISDNAPAIGLYEKMGFRSYDEIRTYQRAPARPSE